MAKKKVTRQTATVAGKVEDYTAASPNDPKVRKALGLDEEVEVVEETETED